jgi:hypothetical protein
VCDSHVYIHIQLTLIRWPYTWRIRLLYDSLHQASRALKVSLCSAINHNPGITYDETYLPLLFVLKVFYSVCRRNRHERREPSPRWVMCDFTYLADVSFLLPHSFISYSLISPAEKTPWLDQCSWSVTFWDGSGSLDPYTGLRIRIRILLCASVASEVPTKK